MASSKISMEQFLRAVVTTDSGYFCLLIGKDNNTNCKEEWYKWPVDLPKIVQRAESAEGNVYFSSYLFSKPDSHKEFVLPSRTIQADLDNAKLETVALRPTVLVETSPGRHQGYWVIQEQLELPELELLSRRVTYGIEACDHSGWPLGHRVRVPGTHNHKYPKEPTVQTLEIALNKYKVSELYARFPELVKVPTAVQYDDTWLKDPPVLEIGPQELFSHYQSRLPRKVITGFNNVAQDRSAALWALMRALFRAEASRDEVFWLAKHSANNKFAELRYSQDLELGKDVLRAEAEQKRSVTSFDDLHEAFREMRKLVATQAERHSTIAREAIKILRAEGDFVECDDGKSWYIPTLTGRPIFLGERSQDFRTLLEAKFGLNATELETRYVVHAILALPKRKVELGTLSFYQKEGRTLLLHSGEKFVHIITAEGVTTQVNGAYGVMFSWQLGDEPFTLDTPLEDWAHTLFEGYFDNVVGLTHDQTAALFKVWILFILVRNVASSRPILALFGQPGSGKSTLFRLIYVLLYGPRKGLSSVTNENDFDQAVATDPFVVLDNVDTWSKWLPDRLALAAATSDVTKRKLYSDNDSFILKRQALIGISAHNPSFGREDVVDRMLLVNFHRFDDKVFKSESDLLEQVYELRGRIWASIVQDLQRCLATPVPSSEEMVAFRIKDFALYGTWIARATGCEEAFKTALESTKESQRQFTQTEEGVLFDSIDAWLAKQQKSNLPPTYHTAGELLKALGTNTSDPVGFSRAYKNSVSFAKKLWVLDRTLRTVYDVDVQQGPQGRQWKITTRQKEELNGRE